MAYVVEVTITDNKKNEDKTHVAYVQRVPGSFGHIATAAHFNRERAEQVAKGTSGHSATGTFTFDCRAKEI